MSYESNDDGVIPRLGSSLCARANKYFNDAEPWRTRTYRGAFAPVVSAGSGSGRSARPDPTGVRCARRPALQTGFDSEPALTEAANVRTFCTHNYNAVLT